MVPKHVEMVLLSLGFLILLFHFFQQLLCNQELFYYLQSLLHQLRFLLLQLILVHFFHLGMIFYNYLLRVLSMIYYLNMDHIHLIHHPLYILFPIHYFCIHYLLLYLQMILQYCLF